MAVNAASNATNEPMKINTISPTRKIILPSVFAISNKGTRALKDLMNRKNRSSKFERISIMRVSQSLQ